MQNPNEIVQVIPIHGPYAGQLTDYVRHAAEAAVTNGFAKWPEKEEEAGAGIPADFPCAKELRAAGIESVEAVPDQLANLMALPGIGKKKAEAILAARAD